MRTDYSRGDGGKSGLPEISPATMQEFEKATLRQLLKRRLISPDATLDDIGLAMSGVWQQFDQIEAVNQQARKLGASGLSDVSERIQEERRGIDRERAELRRAAKDCTEYVSDACSLTEKVDWAAGDLSRSLSNAVPAALAKEGPVLGGLHRLVAGGLLRDVQERAEKAMAKYDHVLSEVLDKAYFVEQDAEELLDSLKGHGGTDRP